MTEFSAEEKRKVITRELSYRRHVYTRRVAEGKMTQANADKQIAVMVAIESDYRLLETAEAEAKKPALLL